MRSCFEVFTARNTMMESYFNFDTWFRRYIFLLLKDETNDDVSKLGGSEKRIT